VSQTLPTHRGSNLFLERTADVTTCLLRWRSRYIAASVDCTSWSTASTVAVERAGVQVSPLTGHRRCHKTTHSICVH
jgi:hypothetical protein